MKSNKFPDLEHSACEIVRFIKAGNLFTILLKDGRVEHFNPKNVEKFQQRLIAHGIDDVRDGNNKLSRDLLQQ